jgi:hypothetical protein
MVTIKAYKEYKPMRDTIEYTAFFVNQFGEKYRVDFEFPLAMLGGYSPAFENESLVVENASYEKDADNTNTYYQPLHEVDPPPESARQWMIDYFRLSYNREAGRELTDAELYEQIMAHKPDRMERWQESFDRSIDGMRERYEQYLWRKVMYIGDERA